MVDQLVMLLSTDWFMPYWNTLDIDLNDSTKRSIQQGCREIVGQILSGATNYYHISFAPERVTRTRSMLKSLANQAENADAVASIIDEYDTLSDEDEKATWIWNDLTSCIFSGRITHLDPALDQAIRDILFAEHSSYEMEPYEFAAICEDSDTAWDRYLQSLTSKQPSALADTLASMLTVRRFKTFWDSVRSRLTPGQRDDLVSWYRQMAKTRRRRDIVPSYVH